MKIYALLFGTAVALGSACAADPASEVMAEVNGGKLTRAEFDSRYTARLFQARNGYHEAERKALDDFIEQYLIEAQAKKENVTVQELMRLHVDSKVGPNPSDEALYVYFEGLDTPETFDAVKGKILEHLRTRRAQKLRTAFIDSLKTSAKIDVKMAAPRAKVSTVGIPMRGPRDAAVTLIEYADYECPYCIQVQPALSRLEAEYKGKIAFAYKDTPLPNHPHAQKAAEATQCAQLQGKYWEMHDSLFSTAKLEVPDLKEQARFLKLDGAAFDKCLDSGTAADLVKSQLTEAETMGIQGTPSFFMNGRFFSGIMTFEQLRAMVDEELGVLQKK